MIELELCSIEQLIGLQLGELSCLIIHRKAMLVVCLSLSLSLSRNERKYYVPELKLETVRLSLLYSFLNRMLSTSPLERYSH